MEKFNLREYRDRLANDLKATKKDNKDSAKELLEKEKKSEKYKKAEDYQKVVRAHAWREAFQKRIEGKETEKTEENIIDLSSEPIIPFEGWIAVHHNTNGGKLKWGQEPIAYIDVPPSAVCVHYDLGEGMVPLNANVLNYVLEHKLIPDKWKKFLTEKEKTYQPSSDDLIENNKNNSVPGPINEYSSALDKITAEKIRISVEAEKILRHRPGVWIEKSKNNLMPFCGTVYKDKEGKEYVSALYWNEQLNEPSVRYLCPDDYTSGISGYAHSQGIEDRGHQLPSMTQVPVLVTDIERLETAR